MRLSRHLSHTKIIPTSGFLIFNVLSKYMCDSRVESEKTAETYSKWASSRGRAQEINTQKGPKKRHEERALSFVDKEWRRKKNRFLSNTQDNMYKTSYKT